jgi:alanyl-tRNA synthetase
MVEFGAIALASSIVLHPALATHQETILAELEKEESKFAKTLKN